MTASSPSTGPPSTPAPTPPPSPRWITETEAERAKLPGNQARDPEARRAPISRDEIASVVKALSDLLSVLRRADQADKAEIYTQLGLHLTYQPSDRTVRAETHIIPAQHWKFESVRGGT